MPFKIVRNDITKMQVDAIVNTANEEPIYSDGVDTAVYRAAGEAELLRARKKIGYMEEGEAAVTDGFLLPAKYIIHAVSPYYIDGTGKEEAKLRSCYQRSLELAYERNCKSIAFPLIATGSYGYPKEEGIRIAIDEINTFLLKHDMLIYLVVFDTEATRLGYRLYSDLEEYIDQNYVNDKQEEEYGFGYNESVNLESFVNDDSVDSESPAGDIYDMVRKSVKKLLKRPAQESAQLCGKMKAPVREERLDAFLVTEDSYEDFLEESESELKERMKHMADTFQQYLLYLIEDKGMSNSEVYKRAIITKQLFSKIKGNLEYHPDKATAMRLCVGAKLSLDETKDLLARAGYALSPSDKRDIIFSYFIEKEVYDMIEIDIVLEEHGLPCFIE